MRNLIAFVIFGLMTTVTTQAAEDSIRICKAVSKLKFIHSEATLVQSVENPSATVEFLIHIEQMISERMNDHLHPEMIWVAANLSELTDALRRSSNDQHLLSGPAVFRILATIMDDLATIQHAFGCDLKPVEGSTTERSLPGLISTSSEQNLSNNLSALMPKDIYVWILILIGMLAFVVLFLTKNRRADERKVCNILLHVVYGEKCTVTRIFNISESGMKIEAAEKSVEMKWLDFHFGGQKLEGRIVWRSKLYAGVKFRKRLSKEALDEIMATNNRPVSESGIEKTTKPCFHDGCHFACPLHLPTALSLKAPSGGDISPLE